MAEVDFERRLERLFAEAPAFPDESAFAERVERRLDRGWRLRRTLIWAAGLIGGVIGASQLVIANVVERVETASRGSGHAVENLTRLAPSLQWLDALPAGSTVIWVASGFALLFLGLLLSRVIEEI
jgi:hypothetical protein